MIIDLIEPYNSAWKNEFEKLSNALEAALLDFDIDIQHVSSTSIPELCAKPVLDIDIILADKILLNDVAARLEKMGYINRGEQGITGRFAFRQSSVYTPVTSMQQIWQDHHLYVCFADSLALKNHLLFRDALLEDKIWVNRYAALKMQLVNQKDMTREEYTKQKTEFIISVLMSRGLEASELQEIRNANR
jgi:GrpB-like predicted nucleotidyltransferase (UPF0157 family)